VCARDKLAECINITTELQNTPVSKLRERLQKASEGLLAAVVAETIRELGRYRERLANAKRARDREAYHIEKLEDMVMRAAGRPRTEPPQEPQALDLP